MQMRLTSVCAACLLAAASTHTQAGVVPVVDLLVDGDLSLANSGTNTSNSPWTLAANMPDGNSPAATFQTGFANAQNTSVGGTEPPGTGTGLWMRSFEGNQSGSGEPLAQAVLTQSVLAPSDGTYQLTFVAGREINFTAGSFFVSLNSTGTGGIAVVDLLAAPIPDGNLGGSTSGNAGGTEFSLTLTGVSAGDSLTVTGEMIDGADSQVPGGQSGFLDSFELGLVVPEPASLGLLGLGVVLLQRRR